MRRISRGKVKEHNCFSPLPVRNASSKGNMIHDYLGLLEGTWFEGIKLARQLGVPQMITPFDSYFNWGGD